MASLSILPAEAQYDLNPAHVSSSVTLYGRIYKEILEQGPGLKPFLPMENSFQKVPLLLTLFSSASLYIPLFFSFLFPCTHHPFVQWLWCSWGHQEFRVRFSLTK